MFRHWGYVISGLFFMIGYGILSGVTIAMAIPLFDYVFAQREKPAIIDTFSGFSTNFNQILSDFFSQSSSIFLLFSNEVENGTLIDNLKELMSLTDPLLLLYIISGSLVILTFIKNIFFFSNRLLFANLRGKTIMEVRNKMFEKYLKQSLAFFNLNKVGDSIVRMVSDVNIVSDQLILPSFNIIRDSILLIVYAYAAMKFNARLFLFSIIALPVFSLVLTLLGKKIKKYAKRIQSKFSDMFSNIEEVLNNMRIVKAFSREDYELQIFKKINLKYFLFWRKSIIYSSINTPLSEMNGMFIAVIVILLGGKLVLATDNDFSYGVFMAFLGAIFSMLHPIKELTKAYTNIKKAQISLGRIFKILNQQSEIGNCENPIQKKSFDNKIELKNVHFSYTADIAVLKNISLEIHKGEKVAFVGSSGSGKTTLVNLLPRMYDIESGEILIDGVDISQIDLKDLRTLFGTVTQESILFGNTIAENIRYGSLEELSQHAIEEAAKISYADEFIQTMPNKYDEMLHQRAGNLSGGQKQRLCIAIAIVSNPPILIFDEATSALDTESENNVQIAIDQATQNRTVVIIAHRLSTILSSDKIVVLDKGEIVGVGKHNELLKTCKRYQTLYNLQFNDKYKEN